MALAAAMGVVRCICEATGASIRETCMKVVAILCATVLLLAACGCHDARNTQEEKAPISTEPGSRNKQLPAAEFILTLDTRALPRGYSGDNPDSIVALLQQLTKGAYEKTTDYEERVRRAGLLPPLSSILAFRVSKPKLFSDGTKEPGYEYFEASYNPDTEELKAKVGLEEGINEPAYHPQALDGKPLKVPRAYRLAIKEDLTVRYSTDHWYSTSHWLVIRLGEPPVGVELRSLDSPFDRREYIATIKVPPPVAEQLVPSLQALVVCRLDVPYLGTGKLISRKDYGSFVVPETIGTGYFLVARPLQLWLYNETSGEVVKKFVFSGAAVR